MIYKTGDILNFAWSGNIFMKAILFRNKIKYGWDAKWTHSGIIVETTNDEVLVAEALDKGFTLSWYEKWWLDLKIKDGVVARGRSKIPLKKVFETAKEYEGRPYAWHDIFNISINFLYNITKAGIFKDFRLKPTGAKHLICSEAVSRILYDCSNKKINLSAEYGIPYDEIDPMQIYNSKQIKW